MNSQVATLARKKPGVCSLGFEGSLGECSILMEKVSMEQLLEESRELKPILSFSLESEDRMHEEEEEEESGSEEEER